MFFIGSYVSNVVIGSILMHGVIAPASEVVICSVDEYEECSS